VGHERLGMLPKTKRWRAIVSEVAESESSQSSTAEIADHTLTALGAHYRDLGRDAAVKEVFKFLVETARATALGDSEKASGKESPLSLVGELSARLKSIDTSLETREIALRAGADAIAVWHRENSSQQPPLFETDQAPNQWRNLGTGAGFSEISRLYFSRLTERYLNYFLDREASSVLPSISARVAFQQKLHEHVSEVSKLSFESSKITQSFAAGWFNKNALTKAPTEAQITKFLSYAFTKLREEFRREGQS
jgi:hypothetical protein